MKSLLSLEGFMRNVIALTLSAGLVCTSCGSTSSAETFVNAPDAGPGGNDAAATGAGSDASSSGSLPVARGPDGGTSNDGGPGGNLQLLACGTTACASPAEACCVTNDEKTKTFGFSCTSGASCKAASNTVTLECTGPSNCPASEVCCIGDDGSGNRTAACRPTCTSGGGVDRATLCDPAALTVGCPTDAPCSANSIEDWNLPNGFGTCGGKGN
jgi:hypothetical protein